MTHGSLFSGIGGFDLAARWMGWDNAFHVERDPFCRQVLTHHFPKSKSYDDIKEFDATPFRGQVQIISGGFPCQPFSAAGKRGGTSDDRYLWPQMFRVIREVRPTWVVAENVRGLLSWNDGLVLDTVCADLEGEGYEVFPTVLPAASVNAPHRRDRIWIVAHANSAGIRQDHRQGKPRQSDETRSPTDWQDFPTVAFVHGGDDGLPQRLDGITFPRWRRESIKAYGNAIVPQVALQIFRTIESTYPLPPRESGEPPQHIRGEV